MHCKARSSGRGPAHHAAGRATANRFSGSPRCRVCNRSIDFRGETRKSAKILKVLTLPKNFLLRSAFPHQRCYFSITSHESRPCRWLVVAYHNARRRTDLRRLVRLLVESIVQNRDLSEKQSQILSRSPIMQAVLPAPRNGPRRPRSSPATPSAAPCTALPLNPPDIFFMSITKAGHQSFIVLSESTLDLRSPKSGRYTRTLHRCEALGLGYPA
eukprot:COSAG06_NODE_3071_length_5894_cov_6.093701_5_plen_214_part_00